MTVRLFADLDGTPQENTVPLAKVQAALSEYEKEKQIALNIVTYEGYKQVFSGQDYDCSVLHKTIKIHENRPKINLNLRKAYQNIYNQYRFNIESYNSRLINLLKSRVSVRDENYQFGSGITSTRLGNPKRRFWCRYIPGVDIPDLAVLFLIDGSGSMRGNAEIAPWWRP